MRLNSKGTASGLFFTVFGLGYGAVALSTLPIGTAMNMGPGYFPLILAILMTVLGIYILVQGLASAPEPIEGGLPLRALGCITLAAILFAVLLEPFGIFPTIFLATMAASAAWRGFRPLESAAACAFIAVLCAVVFGYFLGLPVDMVGPAFGPLSF